MAKKKLSCVTCKRKFTSKSNLERHSSTHKHKSNLLNKPSRNIKQGNKIHKCDSCGKCFPSKFKLDRHAFSHYAIKPFPCDKCEKRFSRKDHLQVHYRLHTGEKTCYCTDCGEGFIKTVQLHRHIMRLHSKSRQIVSCEECGMEFAYKSHLKRHFDCVHRQYLTCNFCGNISYSDSALYRHLRKHILSQPFVCLMCASHFSSLSEMKEHKCFATEENLCKVVVRVALLDGLDFEEESSFCEPSDILMLDKKFDKRGKKPIVSHSQPILKYFQDELREYFENEEEENESRENRIDTDCIFTTDKTSGNGAEYFCKFCEKSFPSRYRKLSHEVLHLDDFKKSPQCTICNAEFTTQAKLAQHLHSHSGETVHVCEFCDKAFLREEFLECHIKSDHFGDDKTCQLCMQTFQSKKELKLHLKSHKSETNNSALCICDFCQTSFTEFSELHLHITSEHPDSKCRHCSTIFYDLALALSHKCDLGENNFDGLNEEGELTIDESGYSEEKFLTGVYSASGPWSCKTCNSSFKTLNEKMDHVKTMHDKPDLYECDLCPTTFTSIGGLRGHFSIFHEKASGSRSHYKAKSFESLMHDFLWKPNGHNRCSECDITFESLHGFLVHMRSHSSCNQDDIEQLNCVICEEKFNSIEDLACHLESHDDNMIVEVGVHDNE